MYRLPLALCLLLHWSLAEGTMASSSRSSSSISSSSSSKRGSSSSSSTRVVVVVVAVVDLCCYYNCNDCFCLYKYTILICYSTMNH